MSKQADEPMNGNTEQVDPADWNNSPEASESEEAMDDVLNEQDEDTYRILAILNQEHLNDTFGKNGTASELDETPEISQAFMDRMRAMVAESCGQEAADQFMTLTNNKNKIESHHQPKTVLETEKEMSQISAPMETAKDIVGAERPLKKHPIHMALLFSTWPRRVAAVMITMVLIFGIYQGGVMATRVPDVSVDPENTEDYSKVGSLKKVLTYFDISSCPKELEHIYVPEKVADGYEEVDRIELSKSINMVFENEDGQWYQYRQMTVSAKTFLDTEQGDWQSVTIGEYPGLYVAKDDAGKLWWFDYQYAYQIQGNLTQADMIIIAESLCELKE